jgi:RimJ/RimL family protein N-acetyltransferase
LTTLSCIPRVSRCIRSMRRMPGRCTTACAIRAPTASFPTCPPASVEALARQASPDGAEIWLNWAIGAAHGASFAGYVQATVRPARAAASIACLVFPDQWRRGVATEAVGAVVTHLFARYPIGRIDAEIDARNRASIALVEALGFARSGLTRAADTFKGAVSDEYGHTLIRPSR